ncbi:hypothetical protein DFP72DRAFT_1060582 [Ephemerocybe angulata]|uniref:F-box domain-containing protein n=1 Tax=Ephemerocybe angulata TaxID=980116 RepID=A0A8H6IDD4_9AGAR|nr:hypothetical protein DFP72DRAFT_1060582 [Tulosesus angulatus]
MPDNPHLSPAQDLPSDILEQILTLAANSAKDSDDPLQPLRCFTAVNHHWNHVSYSCTPLWQNLGHIRVDLHNCRPESAAELLISSLEDRFERARSQPVTFTFNVAPTLAYGRPRDIQLVIERAFAVLAQYSAQWENIGFSLPAAHVHFLDAVAGKVPLLEKISMEVLHPDVPVRLDQFATAPRIRHTSFRFPGKYGVDVRDKIHLPWSQLLSYHEDIFPQDVGFHLALAGSPKLQSLICSFPFTSINYFIAVPVQHSTLTRLHLKFTASNSTILRHLIIPSLEDLSPTALSTILSPTFAPAASQLVGVGVVVLSFYLSPYPGLIFSPPPPFHLRHPPLTDSPPMRDPDWSLAIGGLLQRSSLPMEPPGSG